jgi:hypothetical protein
MAAGLAFRADLTMMKERNWLVFKQEPYPLQGRQRRDPLWRGLDSYEAQGINLCVKAFSPEPLENTINLYQARLCRFLYGFDGGASVAPRPSTSAACVPLPSIKQHHGSNTLIRLHSTQPVLEVRADFSVARGACQCEKLFRTHDVNAASASTGRIMPNPHRLSGRALAP